MSREINLLFISLEKLRMVIEDALSKSEDAAAQATSLRGDWEQELAEQLDDFSERLWEMKMDMETRSMMGRPPGITGRRERRRCGKPQTTRS